MPHYRIYQLDPTGHIEFGSDLHCETDEEALREGASLLPEGALGEIWQGTRVVGRIGKERAG